MHPLFIPSQWYWLPGCSSNMSSILMLQSLCSVLRQPHNALPYPPHLLLKCPSSVKPSLTTLFKTSSPSHYIFYTFFTLICSPMALIPSDLIYFSYLLISCLLYSIYAPWEEGYLAVFTAVTLVPRTAFTQYHNKLSKEYIFYTL